MSSQSSSLPHWMTLAIPAAILLAYFVYYYIFSYFTVKMKGDYDVSKKKIGRPLPPYPNGWYIACKSTQVKNGLSKAIDLSGQNITLFRSKTDQVYGLHSYCAHMGANLGVGGMVVKDRCIQCPFHGWLYDGETGLCVDYDGKEAKTKTIEYNDDFGSSGCKQVQWKQGEQQAKLRKYHVKQMHGFIYVWIHVDQNVKPRFDVLPVDDWINKLSNRGQTIHDIRCHAQDIPENGADVFHFKYIHKYLIARWKMFQVVWFPMWKRGDDPDLSQIFQHPNKKIREFKQNIYQKLVKSLPNKQYYSYANVDNYLKIPILGNLFVFNLTIIQMGPGLVYIFLKTHFFTIVFCQYLHSHGRLQQRLYHQMFASSWLPYWVSAIMLQAEAMQVYYDMLVWDSKQFSRKMHYKENDADKFIRSWRGWASQHYDGCSVQNAQDTLSW